jgi:hypothetical protein
MTSINFEHNIIYYHCHKTAGSFIQEKLFDNFDFIVYNFLVFEDLKRFYLDRNEGIFRKVKRMFVEEKLIDQNYENFKHFSFVRNPYTRFISGWKYVSGTILKNKNKYKDEISVDDLQLTINNRHSYDDLIYTHIFMTQYDMLKDNEGNISLDFIGRYENLISDFKKYLYNFFEKEDVDSIEDVKINENPIKYGNYSQYYTKEILNFVNQNFDEDFKHFNYSKVFKIEDLK